MPDIVITEFGANIFPEHVQVGLDQPDLMGLVSGKFVMEVIGENGGSEFLQIAVELPPARHPNADLQSAVAQAIRSQLLRLNSEFANYVPSSKQIPQVELLPFADPAYFPSGVKHRYTRKI